MRIHMGHDLIRFAIGLYEEPLRSAQISERSICKCKQIPLPPGIMTVSEMKKRFNDISLSFPDKKNQRYYDSRSDEKLTRYVINEIIAGVVREALSQTKNPKSFETHFLPIINQIVDKFSDILDHETYTIKEAKEELEQFYRQIGSSHIYSRFSLDDEKEAISKVNSAAKRAAEKYIGQFNHLPKLIESKILLQYGAKLSRQYIKRQKYPEKD